MKRFLFHAITLWAVLWIQVLSNRLLGGSWLAFDVVLVAVLYFGLVRGPFAGQLMGFSWGLLLDASSLGLMGLHSLLYAGIGFIAGMLRRPLDETKIWTQTIFTGAVSIFYILFYIGLTRVFGNADRPVPWTLAVQPFMNAVIAPLGFWVIARWAEAWSVYSIER